MTKPAANQAGPSLSLSEMCALWDKDFLDAAYWALLRRAPDPVGEAHYLSQLRTGLSKLTILMRLRDSTEGRQCNQQVAGLDEALREHRMAVRPLTGWFVRLVTGRQGDSRGERLQRAIANNLAALDRVVAASTAEKPLAKDQQWSPSPEGSLSDREPTSNPLYLRIVRIEASLSRIEGRLKGGSPSRVSARPAGRNS